MGCCSSADNVKTAEFTPSRVADGPQSDLSRETTNIQPSQNTTDLSPPKQGGEAPLSPPKKQPLRKNPPSQMSPKSAAAQGRQSLSKSGAA